MKPKVPLVLAGWALLVGLAAFASPVSAHGPAQQSAAQQCFERHQFGAQPVDVAKTADGQTVLAQTSWNWHDAIGCYLTLDDQALAILQAAPSPQSLPEAETAASQRCFDSHHFGAKPVDVAKTADGQTVLARLSWGYHGTIGCYLVLDNTALATLRNAHTAMEDTDDGDPTGLVSNKIVDPPQKVQAVVGRVPFVWWTAPSSTGGSPISSYTVAYKAKPYDSNTQICPTEIDNSWTVRTTPRTDIRLGGTNLWTDYSVCVKASNDLGDSDWAGVSFCTHTHSGAGFGVPTELNVPCNKGYRLQRWLDSDYPAWWYPLNSLRVKLHICVDPALAHLVNADDLDAIADLWNEHAAPFYTWQSSGLLDMHMESGRIIELLRQGRGNAYTNWNSDEVVPPDCLKEAVEQRDIIHHFLVYGHEHIAPLDRLPPGSAILNGPQSALYLKHEQSRSGVLADFTWTSLMNSISSFDPSRSRFVNGFLRVINHELDHTLGIRHELNFLGFADTRHYEYLPIDTGPLYLGEFKNGEIIYGNLAGEREAYFCYELRRLGWPTGDDDPACVRHPPSPRSSFYAYPSTERSFEFVWGGSSWPLVNEPVTGQRIDVDRWTVQDDGTFGWSRTVSYSLVADATSFILPRQPIGLYRVNLRLGWEFSDGVFGGTFDVSFGSDVEVIPVVDHSTVPNGSGEGIELSLLQWEAAPGANHYLVSGFEGCSLSFETGDNNGQVYGCGARTEDTTMVLWESMTSYPRITTGKRYDIVIAACYLTVENNYEDPVYEPYEIARHDSCYKWAAVAINDEA